MTVREPILRPNAAAARPELDVSEPSTPAIEWRWVALGIATGLVILSLVLYTLTLAPTVTFGDSGEIALAVATHGVAHPPGTPFYLLLAEIPAALSIGRLIVRLNVFSAICSALAVGLVFLGARQVALDRGDPAVRPRRSAAVSRSPRKGARPAPPARSDPVAAGRRSVPAVGLSLLAVLVAAVGTALLWAVSSTFWNQAVVTEVYALHMATVVGIFLALTRYRRLAVAGDWPLADRWLGVAALLTGLGLSNHLTLGLLAPAVLYLLFRTEGWTVFRRWPRNLAMIGLIVLGLSCYLLLPIRAGYHPLFAWGEADSWPAFWRHVSGKQYQVFLTNPLAQPLAKTLSIWSSSLVFLARLWWQQGEAVWLLLAPLGLWHLWRGHRTWFWFTVLVALTNLAYAFNYDINDPTGDYDTYYLLFFWVSALWSGMGLAVLVHGLETWRVEGQVPRARVGAALALLLLPLIPLALNWSDADHSHYTWAEDYSRSVLEPLAPNAILLSRNWALLAPSLYLHFVESVRPDVALIDQELLRRTWYFQHLSRAYPWLTANSQAAIDAFMPHLLKFENDQPYDTKAIQTTYIQMINDFLAKGEANGRALYATDDIEPGIAPGYQRAPETPADRLVKGALPGNLPPALFPPPDFSPDQVYDGIRGKVLGDYAAFWTNRGQFFQAQQACSAEAVSGFDHAVSLLKALTPEIHDVAVSQHRILDRAPYLLAQCRSASP